MANKSKSVEEAEEDYGGWNEPLDYAESISG